MIISRRVKAVTVLNGETTEVRETKTHQHKQRINRVQDKRALVQNCAKQKYGRQLRPRYQSAG